MLAAGAARLGAQISPGPLSRPHAAFEGPLHCTKCHGGHSEPMTQTCNACHKEIAWLQAHDRGLHARDARGDCGTCHPEHAGRNFNLIRWKEGSAARFAHTRTGWPLEGKHAGLQCEACHKPAFEKGPAATLAPKPGRVTWVGLEQTCTTCHTDVHRGALGATCARCHDERAWKPAPRFDHDSTDYPLTGKHADVACDKCHATARLVTRRDGAGKPIPVFKPVPHRDCVDCHTDPHKGRLEGACSRCHTTRSFLTINKHDFDHDLTRYPLRGKHRTVACTACHVGFPKRGMHPAFAKCTDCHTDPHAGRATLAGRTVDCDACHEVEGFSPSTYTVADHQRAKFKLEGKHARVKCADCHVTRTVPAARGRPATKVIEVRPAYARCSDCHVDDHAGQLASRPDHGACERCHTPRSWSTMVFPASAHAALRLPLDGKHAEIACSACHGPERKDLPPFPAGTRMGKAGVLFKIREVACTDCHVDPHRGRFAAGGAHPQRDGCLACHDTKAFRPSTMAAAMHARFDFALEGAHRATPCSACHHELERPRARSTLVRAADAARPLSLTAKHACADCHDTPHGTQFAGRAGGDACDGCHGVEAFVPASRFDHDRDASFTLAGAHAHVACEKCHHPDPALGPRAPIRYRGVSAKCESCHASRGAPASHPPRSRGAA